MAVPPEGKNHQSNRRRRLLRHKEATPTLRSPRAAQAVAKLNKRRLLVPSKEKKMKARVLVGCRSSVLLAR